MILGELRGMVNSPIIAIWDEPPNMDAGAPEPVVRLHDLRLFVAYRCKNPDFPGWGSEAAPDHPGFDEYFAVIQFDGVRKYTIGAPSEERLHEHPLFFRGLKCYQFHTVSGLAEGQVWIACFHDETLEVQADSATVICSRVNASSADEALKQVQSGVFGFEKRSQ